MAVTSWIRRQFKDGVITTATTTMTNVATSFSVGSGQGTTFPDGSIGPFIVTVDQGQAAEEKILVQSRTADAFAVATNGRGYNGTTAQAHTNAVVLHTIDAQDLDEANQTAVQTLGAIQASGDLLQGSGANALQRLARGSTNQFLQAGASLLQWVGFGVGQSTNSAVGDTAADGTATTPARSDHRHGREAYVTNSIVLGTAAAPGVATTHLRPDDTIAAFDATVPTTSNPGDAAATGTVAFAARRDHVHGREARLVPAKATVSNAANLTTSSNTAAEVDSSLRVTVTVGASGRVLVRQSLTASVPLSSTACDLTLSVGTSATGPWTDTGSYPFNPQDGAAQVIGDTVLTGLAAGSTTFYMAWRISAGVTATLNANTRFGAQVGTYQQVQPI